MKYYKNFDWKGIILSKVYDDTDNFEYLSNSKNVLQSSKTLKSFTSEEDAFTGVFEDANGNEGFLAVNFTDPAKNLTNKVTMTFEKGYSNAIVVRNGKESIEKVKSDSLTIDLAAGEGAFVIPF